MGKSRPELGMCQAVLIGIDRYQDPNISKLATPKSDCLALRTVLEEHYGFRDTLTLLDEAATANNIDATMRRLATDCEETDSLLIYFAGHGVLDDVMKTGAWVVHDSKYNQHTTYVANEIIQQYLKALPSRHVLLISDSCYAGSLFARVRAFVDQAHYADLYRRKSRWGFTSGGKTPVLDGGDEGFHSVFAGRLIRTLATQTEPYVTASQLFHIISPIIGNNHDQKPICRPLINVGDEGGAFLFARRTTKKQPNHEDMEVVLEYQYGSLVLSSSAGGLLVIDGKQIGSLQHYQKATLSKVLAGPHEIVIQAVGYEEVCEEVVVKPNQQVERNYEPSKQGRDASVDNEDPLEEVFNLGPGDRRSKSDLKTPRDLLEEEVVAGNDPLDEAYNLWQGNNKRKIDLKKSRDLFEQEAAKGDPRAKMWIARLKYRGSCGYIQEKDQAQTLAKSVFSDIKEKANEDPMCTMLLATCLENGLGTAQDLPEAVRLYRDVVEKENALGQFGLGKMYFEGLGVGQDDKEAVKWYRLAAGQGNALGQNSLG